MTKKILVIDDEEAVRNSFEHALEETNYKVETAINGEDGVKKFAAGSYDLVFLDLKMPKKDGVETIKEIRKKSKKVPVYIVTAFAKEFFTNLKDVQKEGIKFELLQKPLSKEQIILICKGVLNGPVKL